MKRSSLSRPIGPASRRTVVIALAMLTAVFAPGPAAIAQEGDAKAILKAMSDYLGAQKTISATFDTDIEVITPEIEKIQFTNSGQFLLSRPDKLRASRTGGYADVELVFDGKMVSVLGKNINAYAQAEAAGTVDQLIDKLRHEHGVELPGADLLLSASYDALIAGVLEAKHIGQGVVGGVEVEHLAFRNQDTDWQLWVEIGEHPIPRKYVITSKTVAGAPQYTLRIKEWKTDVPADAFAFQPPAGAEKVDFKALGNIDELPEGTLEGEAK